MNFFNNTLNFPIPKDDLIHIMDNTTDLWESLRGQSIFITGGSGFVGTWLLESLLQANDLFLLEVSIVILTQDPINFLVTSPHIAGHRAVTLLGGDMVNFEYPKGIFPFVLHIATRISFSPQVLQSAEELDLELEGTRRILDFAYSHGVRKFLFTSSGAVYGKQPLDLSHVSEDYPGAPFSFDPNSGYGQTKRFSEFMCTLYGQKHNFDAMIARLFTFIGPVLPLNSNYAVGNFIGDTLHGRTVRIVGDGTPYRSYLYAADLAIWLWNILLKGKPAYPYNVGSNCAVSIADLANKVVAEVAPGVGVDILGAPLLGAPSQRYVPCTKRAEVELGLKVLIPLSDGIRRTVAWHRACKTY